MPDYMFLLESRLSPEQRAVMMRVQELSASMGFNLYLTGGTVRDLITGASLRDLDFTVEGNPSKIARELEKGTQEWFDLAIERELHKTIALEDAGGELRALAREERPTVVLKAWEQHDLLEAVNANLAKRHPDYDAITKLMKVREDLFTAGDPALRLGAPPVLRLSAGESHGAAG